MTTVGRSLTPYTYLIATEGRNYIVILKCGLGPKYWAPHVTDCTGLRNINNYKFKTLKSGRTDLGNALSVGGFWAAESAGGLRFSRQGSETDDLAIFGVDTVAVARLARPIF